MASSKTYLVPVDFSKGSEIALRHAMKLARENNGKLLLVHIVPLVVQFATVAGFARGELEALARRLRLKPTEYRLLVLERDNAARAIADGAKRFHAAMIVMGSHGRTGFQRFMLGSVAERTLRYAECPVLIVKK
jgi:nucleotide-binding universal stress UspA family protein